METAFYKAKAIIDERNPPEVASGLQAGMGMTRESGPPPEHRIEGSNQGPGIADLLADTKSKIKDGDWKGALKNQVTSLGYGQ